MKFSQKMLLMQMKFYQLAQLTNYNQGNEYEC